MLEIGRMGSRGRQDSSLEIFKSGRDLDKNSWLLGCLIK